MSSVNTSVYFCVCVIWDVISLGYKLPAIIWGNSKVQCVWYQTLQLNISLSLLDSHENFRTYLGMWLDVYVQSIVISFISLCGSMRSGVCGLVLMVVVSFCVHVLIPLRLLMFQFYSFFLINVETNNLCT